MRSTQNNDDLLGCPWLRSKKRLYWLVKCVWKAVLVMWAPCSQTETYFFPALTIMSAVLVPDPGPSAPPASQLRNAVTPAQVFSGILSSSLE